MYWMALLVRRVVRTVACPRRVAGRAARNRAESVVVVLPFGHALHDLAGNDVSDLYIYPVLIPYQS